MRISTRCVRSLMGAKLKGRRGALLLLLLRNNGLEKKRGVVGIGAAGLVHDVEMQ